MKRTQWNRKPRQKLYKLRRATKLPKPKIWSTAKADKLFSQYIRSRDGKCKRCGKTEYLQCSHFWARANSATRYYPANCIALCYGCHYGNRIQGWEYNKQGAYRDFMITWLGEEKYFSLELLAQTTYPRSDAILDCMKLLDKNITKE